MKRTYQVLNVKCNGCATTLKNKLLERFGAIEVDLSKEPREISLEIEDEKVVLLRNALKKLGYPMADEPMGFVETGSTKAKSFVSCAIGKMSME